MGLSRHRLFVVEVVFGHRVGARRSMRISRAAFAPHTEETPPPGWVEEPHMYMFLDRHAVLAIPREWPVEEQLVDREFALENVAFGQANLLLDLMRSAYLHMHNQIAEARAVTFDLLDD